MKDKLETAAIYVCGTFAVLLLCLTYWIARLFGVDLGEDF